MIVEYINATLARATYERVVELSEGVRPATATAAVLTVPIREVNILTWFEAILC